MSRILTVTLAILLAIQTMLFVAWVYLGCSFFDWGGDPLLSCRFGVYCTPTFDCEKLP